MRYSFSTKSSRRLPLLSIGLFALIITGCSTSEPPGESLSKKPLPEPESQGAQFLNEFCSKCHVPPHPSSHKRGEWKSVVERMNDNRTTDGLPTLTADQFKIIVEYLEKHAVDAPQ